MFYSSHAPSIQYAFDLLLLHVDCRHVDTHSLLEIKLFQLTFYLLNNKTIFFNSAVLQTYALRMTFSKKYSNLVESVCVCHLLI